MSGSARHHRAVAVADRERGQINCVRFATDRLIGVKVIGGSQLNRYSSVIMISMPNQNDGIDSPPMVMMRTA